MFRFLLDLFKRKPSEVSTDEAYMKYLIVSLGNIGPDYEGTRHNIGFMVADKLSELHSFTFEDKSGNAVRYWLQKENIPSDRLLVICDDLSLPLGKIRIRPQGSDGGHNGLKHIGSVLGSQQFVRMRIGVGNDFPRGGQVDYVLGKFSDEDLTTLSPQIEKASDAVKAFCLSGVTMAMNQYNK